MSDVAEDKAAFDMALAAHMAEGVELYTGPGYKEFRRIHERALKAGISPRAFIQRIWKGDMPRVPGWFEDDGPDFWNAADEMARGLFGYVPVRIIYKDAKDLPRSN